MLSIGKVGGGQGDPRYYLDTVASGREDYYTGHGEARGQWAGSGAGQRGLSGTVDEDEFLNTLTSNPHPGKTVLAYDLTFSAPKSVSVLYGVAEPSVSRRVRDAHDEAVREALGYLEREACWTRRGPAGRTRVKGEGLTVAAFRHRSSRAGDPQLHTHSVVVNATQADGHTTSLDGRALYAHARTAGYLYQAALRARITETVGVEWGPVNRGVADIDGIGDEVLQHFSRRTQEIRRRMAERGGRSMRSARIATLETRRAKDYGVPADRLHEEWRARAAEMGLDRDTLEAVLDRRAPGTRRRPDIAAAADDLSGPDGITRDASTFDRRDALRHWAEAHVEGASVREIEEIADGWIAAAAIPVEPGGSRRAGGRAYSTPEMLRLEHGLVESSTARQGRDVAVADSTIVEELLDARPMLTDEQAALVRGLTTSGDGVQLIRAAAGTGKTFALGTARDAWEAAGIHVHGCAIAARAAVELESKTGIDATTIAQLKNDVARGYGLPWNSVLVVDEAGMVGSRDVAELARHAEETNSKLVLLGDDRQLPELDAGGAFRGLAERLGALELHDVRRQEQAWDREALAHLRHGRTQEWADAYRDHGRIVARRSATELHDALVEDWWQAAREADTAAVMIAHRRADVADLNSRARARMREDGRLSELEIDTPDRSFAVGDRVLARRNDRRLGIVNGTRAEVTDLDEETRSLTLRTDQGDELALDSAYLDDGHLEHGYALTAHAAQGATVDAAFVLGSDDLYREWAYTALTRHTTEGRYYVVSPGSAERCLPGLEPDVDPLDRDVLASLAQSRRKDMAVDVMERRLKRVEIPPPDSTEERAPREPVADEAPTYAEALREKAERMPFWKRGERARLQAVADAHERAAQQPTETTPELVDFERNDTSPAFNSEQLRELLAEPPAAVAELIGERPRGLAGRDAWAQQAAALLEHDFDMPVAELAVDVDFDLDL